MKEEILQMSKKERDRLVILRQLEKKQLTQLCGSEDVEDASG